ncbi:MAG: sulfatase-like hydrolase/transferase, partial [Candidatus Binatia bacterium]
AYQREPGVDDGLAYMDAYDEEIAYTDFEIGKLLEGIDDALGDRTLYVFTADHGESMMEHESWFRHAVHVYDEMVRVPLLVRGPGVVPGRSELLTSGIDVVPTVLAALGLPLAPPMPDVDLRTGKGLDPSRIVYAEASLNARDGGEQWRAAIQGDMKWMIGVRKGNCESSRRRYDLAADPLELTMK